MATAVPSWSEVSVIAATTVALGATARGTLDIRDDFGAYLFVKLGRGGATALTNGVDILIRRLIGNDAATVGYAHPAGIALLSQTAAAANTTVSADAAASQPAMTVASGTGIVAGDIICIQDSGGGVTRLEWQRVSKVAGAVLTFDRPLVFAHTAAQADTVRNKSDSWAPIWLDGGATWEVVIDYGDDAAGNTVTVVALATVYNLDTIA